MTVLKKKKEEKVKMSKKNFHCRRKFMSKFYMSKKKSKKMSKKKPDFTYQQLVLFLEKFCRPGPRAGPARAAAQLRGAGPGWPGPARAGPEPAREQH